MVKRSLLCAIFAWGAAYGADAPDLSAAISWYQKKDYKKATEELARWESQFPEDPELLFYLGRIALREKRSGAAVSYLEKATRIAPENASYFVALGEAYGLVANQSRSFTAAQQTCDTLEHAVALDPKNIDARTALIGFCRKAPSIVGGGMTKAYAQAKELQTLDAPLGARVLAALFESEKRYAEAFATCEEAVKAYPNDYGILFVTGRLAVGSGEHLDEGLSALEKCLALTPPEDLPGLAAVHLRMGQLLVKKNSFADARRQFEACLKEEPENKDARLSLEQLPPSSVSPHSID